MLPWMAAVLSTVATLAITGGFHEDGLADVADGLGGHLPAERALEVMKDFAPGLLRGDGAVHGAADQGGVRGLAGAN